MKFTPSISVAPQSSRQIYKKVGEKRVHVHRSGSARVLPNGSRSIYRVSQSRPSPFWPIFNIIDRCRKKVYFVMDNRLRVRILQLLFYQIFRSVRQHTYVCPAFSKKWTRAFGNDDDDDIGDEYGEEWSARSAGKRADTRSQLLQRAKRIVSWIVRREENIVHIVLLQSSVLGDPVSLSMVHFISFEYFDIQLGFSKLRIVALASERRVFYDNRYSLTS